MTPSATAQAEDLARRTISAALSRRDTVYSAAVFDLDAGPVTLTLPDAGKRFRSMIVITEDQYAPVVVYKAWRYTYTRKEIGIRYLMLALRTLVDPTDPNDLKQVHALQDATKIAARGTRKSRLESCADIDPRVKEESSWTA